jgi:hypothetical protein
VVDPDESGASATAAVNVRNSTIVFMQRKRGGRSDGYGILQS